MATENAYSQSGVNYEKLDPFKILCMELARATEYRGHSFVYPISRTRGESAFGFRTLMEDGGLFHVEEGLGTKNLVADAMQKLTGKKHFHKNVAIDAVAMIVNDLLTQGATPFSLAMHLAVGDSAWFDDQERAEQIAKGWASACMMHNIIWAGGETPTLKGIINPSTYLLSGSAVGYSPQRRNLTGKKIQNGDAIVIFESSGVHANGLTLCRKVADQLPDSYLTEMPDGRLYGEALLEPTIIYAIIMGALFQAVDIHYAVNITGHGWKKFMRPQYPFEYRINKLPTQNPLFKFICDNAGISIISAEAYSTFNMGAGFAVYVTEEDVPLVLKIADNLKIKAFHAGSIRQSRQLAVIIEPVGVIFNSLFS